MSHSPLETRFLRHRAVAVAIACALFAAPAADSSGSAATDVRALLDLHNEWRREWDPGLPKLVWDEEMARSSQEWSDKMARSGKMEHVANLPAGVYGENLSFGDDPVTAAQLWHQEKADYSKIVKKGKKCTPSDLEWAKYVKCGHYANAVDSRFTRLGCGMSGSYLTCRYGYR